MAFRERVVVRSVGPAMRFCDAEIGEQQGSGFGLHRAAAVGMQGELAGGDIMLDDGVVEQGFEQRGAFSIGDAPGDDPAAENIDDDIEIEIAPFRGPHQLRYVPGPNLIWAFGEKFRLLIDGAPQLSTPFADFVMLGENAIHGADRAQIDALVEQAGVDFGWSQINKPRLPQQVEYDLALFRDKRPHWRWPRAHSRKRLSPEGLAAMKASARQPQRCAGGGDQAAARRQSRHGVHQDPPSLSAGGPSNAATFLRNGLLGGRHLCCLQNKSEGLGTPM